MSPYAKEGKNTTVKGKGTQAYFVIAATAKEDQNTTAKRKGTQAYFVIVSKSTACVCLHQQQALFDLLVRLQLFQHTSLRDTQPRTRSTQASRGRG